MHLVTLGSLALFFLAQAALLPRQDLPVCVESCIDVGISAAVCGSRSNVACLCQNPAFSTAVAQCLADACPSNADQIAGTLYGQSACAAIGQPQASNTVASSILESASSRRAAGGPSTVATATANASAMPTSAISMSAPAMSSVRSGANAIRASGVGGLLVLLVAIGRARA